VKERVDLVCLAPQGLGMGPHRGDYRRKLLSAPAKTLVTHGLLASKLYFPQPVKGLLRRKGYTAEIVAS